MEKYLTIETLLSFIVLILIFIWVRLEGIFKKIAEVREETAMFKRYFIPKDDQ